MLTLFYCSKLKWVRSSRENLKPISMLSLGRYGKAEVWDFPVRIELSRWLRCLFCIFLLCFWRALIGMWALWESINMPILVPEPTILLTCDRDREPWLDPIFWVCTEHSSCILSQSDLLDLTGSLWITDFWCWTRPELSIPAAGQMDRGL